MMARGKCQSQPREGQQVGEGWFDLQSRVEARVGENCKVIPGETLVTPQSPPL